MLTTVLVLLLGILTILVIIAANGYFVAQEFTYMSVDRNRLKAQAGAGDAAAARALKVTGRPSTPGWRRSWSRSAPRPGSPMWWRSRWPCWR